ncbi:phosphoribosylamine-glycine ligase [Cavenderia fasciculata]|uniref:Phosphoribosylformylglycinamidine cyclo-ligase n=1 Tax=Cavenderia fasciculata TaxID=261658 RepID=F4PN81_CACFS|nr:phosphoribosylamine-glycine ligase [Cavenderia fasciculata]EGG22934.1 phosphoribosylamine-glycine ligase [Cavenderia fasciculata]|eukprot:XP_004360785.1 phosphoribosylamine-glycine ligase [Cavenderia fasciculata]
MDSYSDDSDDYPYIKTNHHSTQISIKLESRSREDHTPPFKSIEFILVVAVIVVAVTVGVVVGRKKSKDNNSNSSSSSSGDTPNIPPATNITSINLSVKELVEQWEMSKSWNIVHMTYGKDLITLVDNDTAFRAKYPAGSYKPSATPRGGFGWYSSPESVFASNVSCFSFRVRFPTGFNYVKGGKLPGLWIGETGANGGTHIDDGSSVRIMWRAVGSSEVYLYVPSDQLPAFYQLPGYVDTGDTGDSVWRGSFQYVTGTEWNNITLSVAMNTFAANGTANYDGYLAVQINGVKQSYNQMKWIGVKDKLINGLMMQSFFGGSDTSWASPTDQYVDYSQFTMVTSFPWNREMLDNIIVIGSGSREHAIAWKLLKSKKVNKIYMVPGNGSITTSNGRINNAPNVAINAESIANFSKEVNASMVVVGPEVPLVDGLADDLKRKGVPCFGPSRAAAEIEGSKCFSKAFMHRHGIPTAAFQSFTKYEDAVGYVESVGHNVVIKASGCAAGKGVLIPADKKEAIAALKRVMVDKEFGSAGDEVVVEQFIDGDEVSVMCFSDGYTVTVMPPAQDHKRALDGDKGANTGGMGAYSPAPFVTDRRAGASASGFGPRIDAIVETVLKPTINGMRREGRPFVDAYAKGREIVGVERFPQSDSLMLFQAGTTVVQAPDHTSRLVTSGGRVLSTTALAADLEAAIRAAYVGVAAVSFEGMQFRKDIGHRAITYLANKRSAETGTSGVSYSESGVDIERGDAVVDNIAPMAKTTNRSGCVSDLGGFGALFDVKAAGFKDPILVSGTDGVGTKLKIAQEVNRHQDIGIDLVAMCVNDVLVQGAEPLFFLDYFATGRIHVDVATQVIGGIARGCKESGCALIGGETAEMPGMYRDGEYDLAGFAVGAVERDQMLPRNIRPGNILLGLASSGVHSNGYSLVRYLIEKKSGLVKEGDSSNSVYLQKAPFEPTKTLGETLLTPTKLYVLSCLAAIKNGGVNGLAHITGGGITENLPRVLPDGMNAHVDIGSWNILPVFQWLNEIGKMDSLELLRTFNCGIGMVLIVEKEKVEQITSLLQHHNETVYQIGTIQSSSNKSEKPKVIYQ